MSDERGRSVPDGGLAEWLSRAAPRRARGTVGIVLARDASVHALNRRYRRQDRATDVLSFAADAPPSSRAAGGQGYPYLGDVVIARGVAARQARRAGHPAVAERRVLALHGLLHLLGYDHHRDGGAMARLERRLLRRAGIREGLIARAAPPARSGAGPDR